MPQGPPRPGQPSPGQSGPPMGQESPPRTSGTAEDPATDSDSAESETGKYWALQGLRGLPITIDRPSQEIGRLMGEERTFRSLGSEPLLDITVFRDSRMRWLALSVALAVVAWGLLLMARPVASRIRFVVLVAILSCGLPVLGGPTTEFVLVFEHALLAALALIPIWVILSAVTRSIRWLMGRMSRSALTATSASAVVLAGFGVAGLASAAEAQQEELKTWLEPLLRREQPVRVPDDAVVIPYDPEDEQGPSRAKKVLVPYARYVELWNLAYPGREIGTETSAPEFSLAGAKYQATLKEGDHVLLRGTVDIEVFSDQPVNVPLALNNAVVTSAVLDGKPARLETIVPRGGADETDQQQARPHNARPRAPSMLSLLVQGEGHHQLEVTIRIAIDREGGWRRARATIPHAEATAVELKVPDPGTTIRYPLKGTVLTETTDTAGDVLPVTLQESGLWDVTWRAEISPGASDQALTATSAALVDVREDGLRIVWQVELKFGQTERGVFQLDVPSDYLVEDVEGSNVRGWDRSREGDRTLLNVELLKAVKQQETIRLHLSHRTSFISRTMSNVKTSDAQASQRGESNPGEDGADGAPLPPDDPNRERYETSFTTPVVSVPGAALHRGTVQIRRSPVLELRTIDATGVSRTDGESVTQKLAPLMGDQQSPLKVRGYQAYQFNATPFTVRISASRIQPPVEARLRTIVRIGETESTLESEIRLATERRDIYVVEVAIADTLQLEQVTAAGLTDWSLVETGDRRLLRAFFSAGKAERVRLSLQGRLGGDLADQATELPRLEVLNVSRQHGSIVVQTDPALDARTDELIGCQNVLLERVANWLSPEQRGLARLAVEYRGTTYSGKILVSRRQPRVSCNTITNVRVTYRDIQETILLDFEITVAGVRQLRFRLPPWLRDADISAPRLRQKTITPLDNQDHVQVELTLQDAVTGQYRVVVENDRALAPQRQLAPLPLIDTGTVNNRYVTLENAGRDEIVVDGVSEMEAVARGSRAWKQLTDRLRAGNFATVYVATTAGTEPMFGYRTKQRKRVVTAGATIGLARTTLVLDPNGAYRASMLLKVDNRTEPYLEIRLPPNAELWTTHVAGDPVKPAQSVTAHPDAAHPDAAPPDRLRRIPLIKTEEGDLDYEVVLKYAGQLGTLRFPRSVRFPIIRSENINIELSQVKLYLPETHRWYHFDGTAARVAGEEDFEAGFVAYQTQQIEELAQTIRSSNQFSRSRAIYNVEKLGKQFGSWHEGIENKTSNEVLQSKLERNRRVFEAAEQQIRDVAGQEEQTVDNRGILNRFYEQQENRLSKNSVTRLGSNFSVPEQSAPTRSSSAFQFNSDWFLADPAGKEASPTKKAAETPGGEKGNIPQSGKARLQQRESYRVRQQAKMPAERDAAQQVFQKQSAASQPVAQPPTDRAEHQTKADLGRAYQERIQDQEQRRQAARGRQSGADGDGRRESSADLYTEGDQSMEPRRGLSSLDFQLPTRGQVFHFATPDHEVRITARPLRRELQDRVISFAGLLLMIGALLMAIAIARRLSRSRIGRTVSVTLLCGCGLVLIVLAVFPLFGIAMFLGSVLLAIQWHRRSKHACEEG